MRLNISIDDVSPHHLSGIEVVDRCFDVIDVHPNAKFTLFVPTAYWRTVNIPGRVDTRTERPLYLAEHPEFCRKLRALPRSNFQVCYHGRFHGIPGVSNNDEMRGLSYDEFVALWNDMRDDVRRADLDDVFVDVIRPPAMYMSQGSIRAAIDLNIRCLALSPREIHTKCYGGEDLNACDRVVYANAWLPDDDPRKIAHDATYMSMLYHACTWDRGYLDDDKIGDLIELINEFSFDFAFIDELLEDR